MDNLDKTEPKATEKLTGTRECDNQQFYGTDMVHGNDVYVWITSTRQNQKHRRSLQEQENVTTSNFMAPTWSMEMQQQKQELARVQIMFYFVQQMKPNASNQGFPFKAPQSIAWRREARKEEALDDLP